MSPRRVAPASRGKAGVRPPKATTKTKLMQKWPADNIAKRTGPESWNFVDAHLHLDGATRALGARIMKTRGDDASSLISLLHLLLLNFARRHANLAEQVAVRVFLDLLVAGQYMRDEDQRQLREPKPKPKPVRARTRR
jgi:hypothetical protein